MGNLSRSAIVLSLFEKYYDRVFCFAKKSLPPSQAEDIAQEVFIRLLEVRELERMSINISYLLKIGDNLIKRRYQRCQRFNRFLASAGQAAEPIDESLTPRSVLPLESEELSAALNRLSQNERDAVWFIICEGMSYETAARTMGVSVTTVNNWKFRGLRKLKGMARRSASLSSLCDHALHGDRMMDASIDSESIEGVADVQGVDAEPMRFDLSEEPSVEHDYEEVLVAQQPGLKFHRPVQIPA